MLNLDVYNGRELQKFISILEQFKLDKITDAKSITDFLRSELNERFASAKKVEKREQSKTNLNKNLCPSCKKGRLLPAKNNENLNILGCSLCRYSAIMDKAIGA